MSKEKEQKKSIKEKNVASIFSGITPTDYLNYLYLALIFTLYLLVVDNGYFNITVTRYTVFMYLSCGFIVLSMVLLAIEIMHRSEEELLLSQGSEAAWYKRPGMWMAAFMIANLFAFFLSAEKENAIHGGNGRYMGLLIYLVFGLLFFILGRGLNIIKEIFYVFAAGAFVALCVAISQHQQSSSFPFSGFAKYLKEGISEKQYTQFVSTFGNINIFAGFLCIAVPVFIGMFVFFKAWHAKLVSGIMLVLSGYAVFVANSDSVYFGIALASVCILLLAVWNQTVFELSVAYVLLALGNLWVELMNTYGKNVRYDKKRGGFSLAIDRLDYAISFLMITFCIAVVVFMARRFIKKLPTQPDPKKMIIVLLSVMGAGVLGLIVYAVFIKRAVTLPLDYKWGTYRGYIWTKAWEIFRDAPFVNKLFGYGHESVRALVEGRFYEEMVEVTGRTYDNTHNELLQYLLTTGLCGLVTYLGLLISSIRYMLKNAKKDVRVYLCVFAVLGYFAQSIISLNQPITTPLFFIFLAMGVGFVNDKNKKAQNRNGGNKNDTV